MLLATRCPHCETVFRLQQDHLTLHGGLVRCGHCQQVFDAASSLVEPEPLLEAAARAASGPAAPDPSPGDAAHPAPSPVAAVDVESPDDIGDATVHQAPAIEPAAPAPSDARHEPVSTQPAIDEAPSAAATHDDITARVVDEPTTVVLAHDAEAALTPTSHDVAHAEHATPSPSDVTSTAAAREPAQPVRPGAPPVIIASPPFATAESAASSEPQDFAPGAWDMWAPWLDGGIDPALQHSGANISTAPLVPLALPEQSGPGADGVSPVARFSGSPQPFAADEPAHAEPEPHPATPGQPPEPEAAHLTALHAAAPSPDELEPTLAAAPLTAPDGDRDHREPRFAASPDASGAPDAPFATAPTDDAREHFAMTRETRAPQRRGGFLRVLGGFVIGLALTLALLLIVQLAWWQREKAMVYWPASQTLFARACATLGCHVAPPRAIDGLRLDASDLRQLDGPHVLELKVPLTNHYSVALAYPAIELTLLDEANRVAVRRVLAPRDYIRPGASIDAGIPAGATQTMVVRIETGDVTASNFRVQIFYP